MPAPSAFPSRGFRRTRERASGLLFAFGVDDLSTTLPTGQTLALTRASTRTVLDSVGRVTTIGHSQMPWSSAYNSTEGVWEPTLDTGDERTNLCLQSENFGTTWSAIGTPTRTAAAAKCGDLSLDLIGDDAAGTLEGYSQVVTFTASATKAVSLFMKAGTSTSTVIRLRDTTASANRLLAVVTWASGVPTVTMTTGTNCGTVACYGGVYRFLFRTGTVTPGNTNQLEVYPASTSALAVANTGTVYAGGVQCENFDYPRAYVKTTTATVTHNKDHLQCTIGFVPQDLTIYGRLATPQWRNVSPSTSSIGVVQLGTAANSLLYILRAGGSTQLRAAILDASTTALTADQTLPATDLYDFCAQFVNLTTAPKCRLDIGSGFGSYSSTGTGFTAFGNTTMLLGTLSTTLTGVGADTCMNSGLRKLIIAPGARTLAEMRWINV